MMVGPWVGRRVELSLESFFTGQLATVLGRGGSLMGPSQQAAVATVSS